MNLIKGTVSRCAGGVAYVLAQIGTRTEELPLEPNDFRSLTIVFSQVNWLWNSRRVDHPQPTLGQEIVFERHPEGKGKGIKAFPWNFAARYDELKKLLAERNQTQTEA